MRILHGVVLALAFSADGACAWIASSAVVGQGVAKGMVERRRGGLSLCMKAKPSPGGGEESQRTRREAIALGGAAAAGSLAQPAEAAEKKKKKMQPVVVTDKEMTEVKAGKWLERHKPGTRDLVVGLEGEPYFLLSGKDGVEPYALRAECTHLGCIAAWRPEVGKHVCPCHGSEYDKTGAVLRGPAPRPLELAQVEVLPDGKIRFSEWEIEDFRKS